MKIFLIILAMLALGGCAAYDGAGLKPGVARFDEVLQVMGQPSARWQEPDGTQQLAYPRGPMGFHTFMAYIGPDGKLQKIENVMDLEFFARIRPGMTKDQVLRVLGPSWAPWSSYFKARDELVWEWRHCDEMNEASRFDVLFDNSKETVRSTMRQTESQMGLCNKSACWCSR